MALFGFLLATVHIPGITGISTLAGWSFLSIVLPLLLLGKLKMTPGHWLGVIFLAYAALSLAWSERPIAGIETLWHWMILGGAFCLGHRLESLRGVFIGLGIGLAVSVAIGAFQIAGFSPVHTNAVRPAVSGLFYNSIVLSETAAIVFVGLLVYRQWWLAGVAVIAILMGEGRAAVLAAGITLMACFIPARFRFLAAIAAAAAMLAVFALKGGGSTSMALRWEAIQIAFAGGVPLVGHGVGSFFLDTGFTSFERLHNDFLEVIYEFGIGAIPLFALLISAACREGHGRPILLCCAIIACFSFPAYLPVSGFVAAVVAGHLHRSRAMVWDHGAVRRHHIHESLGRWGFWSDPDGGRNVPVQSAASYRAGKIPAAG